MCLALGPGGETEEVLHAVEIERRDLHVGEAGELRVSIAMVGMPVGVHHQQGKFRVATLRQQSEHGFRHRHFRRVGDGAGIDQQRFLVADQQEKKIAFGTEAQILAQDEGLRFVLVYLQRWLRIRLAIRGARIPMHVHRARNNLLRARVHGGAGHE